MTRIILHGKLARIYRKEFVFENISKPLDALQAIETIYPGFRKDLQDFSQNGMHYDLLVNDKKCENLNQKQKLAEINIVPCIVGSIAIFQWIWTWAQTIYAAYQGLAWYYKVAIAFAVGVVAAGIGYLMTDIPEIEPSEISITTNVKNASYIFQTPQNVAAQGRPVPIIYGRLRVGSFVVSQKITNYDLDRDNQNVNFDSLKSQAIQKIQESFGSSSDNYLRGI